MVWQWINQLIYIFTSTCFVKNANCSLVCRSYNLDYDDWFILIFLPQAEIHSTGIQYVFVLCFFFIYCITTLFIDHQFSSERSSSRWVIWPIHISHWHTDRNNSSPLKTKHTHSNHWNCLNGVIVIRLAVIIPMCLHT